jgi:hypothetical protein
MCAMEPSSPYRPRVSRETRLLLITGVAALAVLWLLARLRFDERPVSPSPVPAVLSQLGSAPRFDDLASDIDQLQGSLVPALAVLDPAGRPAHAGGTGVVAVRWRDDLGIAFLPSAPRSSEWTASGVRGRDPASGIAVVRIPGDAPTSLPPQWTPRRPQQPRFFAAAEAVSQRIVLRPVFVGGLTPVTTPFWPEPVWAVPPRTDLVPGSVVFTGNAELAGLVLALDMDLVIVPAATLAGEAARLVEQPPGEPGTIGVEAQTLTPTLAEVTGATEGVVVSWVDRAGPAAGSLRVGDVIEAEAGRQLTSRQDWDVRMARLRAGDVLTLRVRRYADVQDVRLSALPVAHGPSGRRTLGLTLRTRRGAGAEVLSVEPGSAGDRAGLMAGDVITLFAETTAPSEVQITRAFAALSDGGRVMVAFTREDAHHVAVVER